MNRWLGTLALVLGAAVAAPIAQAETPASTLVIAMNIDDIISLDPAETFEIVGGEVNGNIYDRITVHEPGHEELSGGVAGSWDIADDGHTIILHLRPGLKFHSGNPITADDVVFSLARVIKLGKTPSFILSQMGWKPDNVDQMVTAKDPQTVELKVPEKLAPTLVLNCLSAGVGSVVDKQVALAHEANGDFGHEWLKTNSAASGPFALKSWKPNESVILEAASTSRYGAPGMKRVILRHVPEPGAQRLLIEKGDADIARNLSADQIAGLEGNKDIRIQTDPKALSIYLQVNMRDPILSKPKVREALRYLVDYQGMVNTFLRGQFIVHQSFWPSGFFASLTDNPFSLDVTKAKSLLAEAGYPDGFEVTMDCPNDRYVNDAAICQAVVGMLARIGVKVNLLAQPKAQYFAKVLNTGGYQTSFYLLGWTPGTSDSHNVLYEIMGCRDDPKSSRGQANLGGYCNKELDALTAKLLVESDTDKRDQMIKQAYQMEAKDFAYIPLHQQALAWGVSKKVKLKQRADNAVLLYWATKQD